MFDDVPRYGRIPTWCRYSGLGRSLSIEMVQGGVLPVVEIEGRKWIDIHAGLRLLDEAAQAKTPVVIPGEHRTRELERKARIREAARAAQRAAQRRKRGRRSQSQTEGSA